ncbi:hypothetical protein ACIRD3_37115 [Kitasatospora sp. NPDC093550]|uniref:hypothetical protein n=1 Tax=Kitasatospora sp. NPDC093550 TaxID=3364089 RepID=UPI0037F6C12F
MQQEIAAHLEWDIAKLSLFTAGVEGYRGEHNREQGRTYEMTVDQRNPTTFTVYYYSLLS